MNRRHLFRWVAAAVLVAAGWWVLDEETTRPLDPELVEEETERRPDYFIEDFHSVNMGADGLPAWELRAPRMVHFIDIDTWELDAPVVLYHTERGEPWELVGQRGRAWSGLTEAVLEDSVVVSREAGPHNLPGRLDTSELWLYPPERLVHTNRPATYRTRGSVVEGIGARGNLAVDTLNLLSEVKARYAPDED